ncbi:chemotaxis protein CheC [Tissierella creatinophila]|uniref:CheY-P phosphatase CheC n=1 Tax=Tissierella creatinophila DSM 6911 TaxID=1123403 RepID=A0A1U7M2I7_TISCR|nr:chemotaxis protein CheC [Tissierella creatinophila]OLS01532.1 CheY-P phosphatase CheC [Tissierella creatinophila DSM 6911]
MMEDTYTHLQIDCLREVVNIGGGNAATSLSRLLNKRIDMTVPIIEVLSYEEVYTSIMAEDKVVNSVIMNMMGDGEGIFVFIASMDATESLAKMMMQSDEEVSDEIKNSALVELVNITVSSFLNAISKMIDANLITSIPFKITDMFGAVLSSVYMETEYFDENIMIIKNEFSYNGNRIETSLYFVPRPGVLEKLFKTLGV